MWAISSEHSPCTWATKKEEKAKDHDDNSGSKNERHPRLLLELLLYSCSPLSHTTRDRDGSETDRQTDSQRGGGHQRRGERTREMQGRKKERETERERQRDAEEGEDEGG